MTKVWTVICSSVMAMGAVGAQAAPANAWPDNFLTRVEALAVLQTFNATLLASKSATLTLEKWCGDHHLADPARVAANRVAGVDKAITTEQRERLNVGPNEPIKYRRVQLSCGGHILSEADNWYVPSRLTAEMNQTLDATDTSFGRVVLPLHPVRQTISAELLWSPLPQGWEQSGTTSPASSGVLQMPEHLLEHRAVLFDDAHRPFSEVVESYTSEILDFAPPPQSAH